MPFQQVPPDVVLPGFEVASASQPYQGETVNGDALFAETSRTDGAFLLLVGRNARALGGSLVELPEPIGVDTARNQIVHADPARRQLDCRTADEIR